MEGKYNHLSTLDLFLRHAFEDNSVWHLHRIVTRFPDKVSESTTRTLREKQLVAAEMWNEISQRLERIPAAILYEAIDGKITLSYE